MQTFLAGHGEEEKCTKPDHLSPVEQVQLATDCLQTSEEMNKINPKLSFQRWTILDYSRRYMSQEVTPVMVLLDHPFHNCQYEFLV